MATLEVVYRFRNQANQQVNQAKQNVKGLGNTVRQNAADIGKALGMVGIGFAAVGTAGKLAYDEIARGVELEETTRKFDRLANSIGTTSDMLEFELSRATNQTMSSIEAMDGALELMSLGFVKNEQEAVRMSRVVGALNMDMNQLSLTLANKTTARFDSLGVATDGFKDRLQELTDAGMDADAAFTEAFLQQAEEQIEKVGDSSLSTAGDLKALEAQFKNSRNEASLLAATLAGPLLSSLADNARAQDIANKAIQAGIITQEEYNQIEIEAGGIWASNAEVLAVLNETINEKKSVTDAVIETERIQHEQMMALIEGQEKAAETTRVLSADTDAFGWSLDNVNQSMLVSQDLYKQAQTDLKLMQTEQRLAAVEAGEHSTLLDRINAEIDELENQPKDFPLDFHVRGLDALRQARDLLANIRQSGSFSGGQSDNDMPDPFDPAGDRTFRGDAFDRTMGSGVTVNGDVNITNPPSNTTTAEDISRAYQ